MTTSLRTAVERVADQAAATELGTRILDPRRTLPIVVISTPMSVYDDAIDAAAVQGELDGVAEVVEIVTGDVTRTLEAMLPPKMQVYGGAGRSYHPRFMDDPTPRRSPLRFAWFGAEKAARLLVADALGQAHSAGAFERLDAAATRTASGTVRGLTAGTRALVELDSGGNATVWQETTFPPAPLAWVLEPGMRVTGTLDRSGRLVLDERTPTPDEFARAFPHGSVTLALVTAVDAARARLALHPRHVLEVRPGDVTSNPRDRLDLLFSVGEVVAARVLHTSNGIRLRMSDVDDDDPIAPALALLDGGPAWLEEGRSLPGADSGSDAGARGEARAVPDAAGGRVGAGADATDAGRVGAGAGPTAGSRAGAGVDATAAGRAGAVPDANAADHAGADATVVAAPEPATDAGARPIADDNPPAAAPVSRPVPTPGMVSTGPVSVAPADGADAGAATPAEPGAPASVRAPASAPPAEPPTERRGRSALQSTQLELERERAGRRAAEKRLAELQAQAGELERLHATIASLREKDREVLAENGELRRQLHESRESEAAAKRALREARRTPVAADAPARPRDRREAWADEESWLRHEIRCAWVERVAPSEKASLPLAEYRIGPAFAASMLEFDAPAFAKALKAVVDVLTGTAPQLAGRRLHQLRTSDGGGTPQRARDDGAVAWRCAIEQNTPSARRLHYWVLPDGVIELARVGVHDDLEA